MERVRALAVPAAASTGIALAVDAVLGLVADTDDHTRGAGLASELLFALTLLLVAVVVVGIHLAQRECPSRAWRAVSSIGCWVAVAALVAAAVVAVSVPIRGQEPPDAVSTPVVLAALLGLIAFGAAVAALGVVSRWIGVVLAVFFPVVFLGGAVGALAVAAAWLLAAWALATSRTGEDGLREDGLRAG